MENTNDKKLAVKCVCARCGKDISYSYREDNHLEYEFENDHHKEWICGELVNVCDKCADEYENLYDKFLSDAAEWFAK